MDTLLGSPAVTPFEAATSAMSALIYIAGALAALARAPRDPRVRVFQLVALSSLPPFIIPVLFWKHGESVYFTKPLILALALSLTTGSLALFHFLQIFPWRRPWIREQGRWLAAAYVCCPIVAAGLVLAAPPDIGDADAWFGTLLLLVGVPALTLVGVVLPFAGLFSIYKSWLVAKRFAVQSARAAAGGILVSQLFGGVLAILIVPVLHLFLPAGPWATIAATLAFGFELMMPIVFVLAIWRDGILELDPARPPAPL